MSGETNLVEDTAVTAIRYLDLAREEAHWLFATNRVIEDFDSFVLYERIPTWEERHS